MNCIILITHKPPVLLGAMGKVTKKLPKVWTAFCSPKLLSLLNPTTCTWMMKDESISYTTAGSFLEKKIFLFKDLINLFI